MPGGMLLLSSGTQLGTACLGGCWLSAGTVFSLFLLSPGSTSAHQTSPGFPARAIFSSWNIKSALGLVMRAWSYQISADLPAPANTGLNGAEALADLSHGDVSHGQKQVPRAAALTPASSFSISNLIALEPPCSIPAAAEDEATGKPPSLLRWDRWHCTARSSSPPLRLPFPSLIPACSEAQALLTRRGNSLKPTGLYARDTARGGGPISVTSGLSQAGDS